MTFKRLLATASLLLAPVVLLAQGQGLDPAKLLKPLDLKVSRIAAGVPMGGELEFVDHVTLGRALEGRRPM